MAGCHEQQRRIRRHAERTLRQFEICLKHTLKPVTNQIEPGCQRDCPEYGGADYGSPPEQWTSLSTLGYARCSIVGNPWQCSKHRDICRKLPVPQQHVAAKL